MDLLELAFLLLPFAVAFGMALSTAVFGGLVLGRPLVPLLLYLSVFMVFPQSNYGRLDAAADPIYYRGTGQMFFPALLWGLLVLAVWTRLGQGLKGESPPPLPPIMYWFAGWLVLLAGHAAWGLATDQTLREILNANGFSLIPWMGLLVLVLTWSNRDGASTLVLSRFIVLVAAVKSAFGLSRYLVFGGDPSNIYQNFGKIDVKLTFFDINDSIVNLIGLVVCVSLLLIRRNPDERRWWTWVYAATALLALACIVLSYRRTVWLGLGLSLIFVVLKMNVRMRSLVALTGVPLVAVGVLYAASNRLAQTTSVRGWTSFFFDLLPSRFGPVSERSLELALAWDAFMQSPILGLGSWGRYGSAGLIRWQGETAGAFLHSGVLHIAMKSGMIGLILFAGVIWAFVKHVRKLPENLSADAYALVLAGCAGLLFVLPDMIVGTPIPQIRTTQLLALCLGLPYFVSAGLGRSSVRT